MYRPDDVSFMEGHENLRPQVFGDIVKDLDPSNIPQVIEKYVRNVFKSALDSSSPKSKDRFEDSLDIGAGIMLFKIPDDLHLMPLVEKEMYRQLRAIDAENGRLHIDPELLAPLDPEMPQILEIYYPDEEIPIETPFQHEMRHFVESEENKKKDVIYFRFEKQKVIGKRLFGSDYLLTMVDAGIHNLDSPKTYMGAIHEYIGPQYPSESDITKAQNNLNQIMIRADSEDDRELGAETMKGLNTLKTSEWYYSKIVKAWVDYNWRQGEWLSALKASATREKR